MVLHFFVDEKFIEHHVAIVNSNFLALKESICCYITKVANSKIKQDFRIML